MSGGTGGVVQVGPGRELHLPSMALRAPGPGALLLDALHVRRRGARVVVVAGAWPRRADAWRAARLGGATVLVTLDAPPREGERWPDPTRAHRYLCPDGDIARAWGRAGIPLGRLVVVPTGPWEREALEAVLREVRAMRG